MLSQKSLQWWTGFSLICLLVSFVVFAFVARKPLCIDSKLVERIDSVSDRGTATAFRCGLHRQVDYNETIASISRKLGRRLQKVERFLEWVGPLKSKINLTLVSGEGSFYRIQGHEIYASESILMAQGQLEKALFTIWFRERAHESLHGKTLIEASLTDFIYAAYSGSLDIQEPSSRLFLSDDLDAKWPRILMTAKGVCHSLWKTMDQLKICDNLQDFSVEDGQLDLISLRPLISQALLSSFEEMSSVERINVLKTLGFRLNAWIFADDGFGMSSQQESQQSYTEASFMLESWTRFLQKISPQFSTLFSRNLKARGFQGIDMVADLDFLIFSADLSAEMQKNLLQEMHEVQKDLFSAWIRGDQIQMNMDGEPMNAKMFGAIKATKGIYLHCGRPEVGALVEAAGRVQRLLFVDACDLKNLKISGYLKKGSIEFALQNPKIKFVDFHSPSLLSALSKVPGVNPIEALAAKEKFKHFFQQLGWLQSDYDQGVDAYRAQSAIEAIDWYRL